MSQGYIGYHLQNALLTELKSQNMEQKVATIITQVEVDEFDQAFKNPTKPIGSFYDEATAKILAETKNYQMVEDAGRGYRRVVPSPKPINVVELDIIKTLVDAKHLVITVGGGGIPVIKKDNEYVGVPAVIDKDFASAKLADLLDADMLIILTAVNKVKINFNKPNEESLDNVTVAELDKYINEGHFLKGSMLPKIEASKSFVNGKDGRIAIIAALEEAGMAINGKAGTIIRK
jgi:carbamate kinase